MATEHERATEATSNGRQGRGGTQASRKVHFVRLNHIEKANLVVLSSPEKYRYAKAMLKPLMEHLASQSTVGLWQQLKAWEAIVADGLQT